MNVENFLNLLPNLKLLSDKDSTLAFECSTDNLLEYAKKMKENFSVESLVCLAAMDFGENKENRFGAVYNFFSHSKKFYVRFTVYCKDSENPSLPSIESVYKSANWQERESYDMMGIVFEKHPDLRRILMWDSYPWYPLRKDFPVEGKEAPLPDSFVGNEDVLEIGPAAIEGGPFYSSCGESFQAQREARGRAK